MILYQLGLLGQVTSDQVARIKRTVHEALEPCGLSSHIEISRIGHGTFSPRRTLASVALYFGGSPRTEEEASLQKLMRDGTPVVPVVSDLTRYQELVPPALHGINGLRLEPADADLFGPTICALQVLGLLHRQRRVFLSYRQVESRDAALQLFEYLSGKHFDVFLDTHGVPPAVDFQEILWHRLSDSDVMIMLDTEKYFGSRWTAEEFGRALAKSLVPVRIGWPNVVPPDRTVSGESIQLSATDFDPANSSVFAEPTLERILISVERARSRSIAIRSAELCGAVIFAAKQINGAFLALGPGRSIVIQLPNGKNVLVAPTVGVPTAQDMYETSKMDPDRKNLLAVVFDDVGIAQAWQDQLKWLGSEVKAVRWLKRSSAATELATWSAAK